MKLQNLKKLIKLNSVNRSKIITLSAKKLSFIPLTSLLLLQFTLSLRTNEQTEANSKVKILMLRDSDEVLVSKLPTARSFLSLRQKKRFEGGEHGFIDN